MKIAALSATPEITLYHTGPALDHGPLPAFFYFSLSGPDSLQLDPYNQPVQFLTGSAIRIFSLTLPGHEANLPAANAMTLWAEDFARGINPIAAFCDQALDAIAFAIRQKFVDPNKMAIGGLSRGVFAAAHVAAREPKFKHILGFAPLTRLNAIKEFKHLDASKLDIEHLPLEDRHIRFYMGNHDTRTGTRHAFDTISTYAARKRNVDAEMVIYRSVGQMGHGTPPEIFKQGAAWLRERL